MNRKIGSYKLLTRLLMLKKASEAGIISTINEVKQKEIVMLGVENYSSFCNQNFMLQCIRENTNTFLNRS